MLQAHQVGVGDHAERLAVVGDHGHVMDASLVHQGEDRRRRRLPRYREHRRGHDVGGRGVWVPAGSDHLRSEIAIRDDPQGSRSGVKDEDRRDPLTCHQVGRLLDRAARGHRQRGSPNQSRHMRRPCIDGLALGSFEHRDLASPEAPREEAETAPRSHDLEGHVPVDEVADRVLGGTERERRLESGEQGHEPEQLALPQHVGDGLALHRLDRAGANDVEERARRTSLMLDHGPDGEELDLGVPNHLSEPLIVQLVEGRIHPQEGRDVHAGEYRIDRKGVVVWARPLHDEGRGILTRPQRAHLIRREAKP